MVVTGLLLKVIEHRILATYISWERDIISRSTRSSLGQDLFEALLLYCTALMDPTSSSCLGSQCICDDPLNCFAWGATGHADSSPMNVCSC